jgi:hypothetical protein
VESKPTEGILHIKLIEESKASSTTNIVYTCLKTELWRDLAQNPDFEIPASGKQQSLVEL